MTDMQTQILDLFRKLSANEQRELVERLSEQTRQEDFFERMTPDQRAELAQAIDQANRGDVVTSNELRAYMAQRFKLT